MTKLKNTKKGMAKKALSISLVAAMLATSNVPVWAAEFTDGEVAAFTSEVEAPVVETEVAPVEEVTEEVEALAATDEVKVAFTLKDNGWGYWSTLEDVTVENIPGNASEVKYKWLVAGKEVKSGTVTPDELKTLTESWGYKPAKDDFGKTLQFVVSRDASDVIGADDEYKFSTESNIVTIGKRDIAKEANAIAVTTKNVVYDGKEHKDANDWIESINFGSGELTYANGDFDVEVTGDKGLVNTNSNVTIRIQPRDTKYYTGEYVEKNLAIGKETWNAEKQQITAKLKTNAAVFNGKVQKPEKKDIILTDTLSGATLDSETVIDDLWVQEATATDEYTKAGTYHIWMRLKADKINYSEITAITAGEWEVKQLDLADCTVVLSDVKTQNGAITPSDLHVEKIVDTAGNETPFNVNKFEVTAVQTNTGAIGSYTATVKATSDNVNYTGTTTKATFNVYNEQLEAVEAAFDGTIKVNGVDVSYASAAEEYTGEAVTKDVTKLGHLTAVNKTTGARYNLTADVDYDANFTYKKNTNAGTATLIVKGLNSFAGSTLEVEFKINKASVADADVKAAEKVVYAEDMTAEGYAPQLTVVGKNGATPAKEFTLEKDKDYTVTYTFEDGNDVEGGINEDGENSFEGNNYVCAHIVITNENFKGGTTEFYRYSKISKPQVSDWTVSTEKASYTYTGEAIVPELIVKAGTMELEKDVDYEIRSIANGTNVGTATVTIAGKGDYDSTSTTTTTFQITEANMNDLTVNISDQEYTGQRIRPTYGDITTFKLGSVAIDPTQFTITYPDSKDANKQVGTGTVTLAPKTANKNFIGSKSVSFNIVGKKISGLTIADLKVYDAAGKKVTVEDEKFTYDGKAHTFASAEFDYSYVDETTHKTIKLEEGKDFEIKYFHNVSGNEDDKAYIAVVGKGNYAGDGETFVFTDENGKEVNAIVAREFEITSVTLNNTNVKIANGTYAEGMPVKPVVSVTYGRDTLTLVEGKDYELVGVGAYTEPTTTKKYTVAVKGINGYTGLVENLAWGIDKKDLAKCNVTAYRTEAGTLFVSVMNGQVVVDSSKYTVTENTDDTVTVKPVADSKYYTGSATAEIQGKEVAEKPAAPFISKVEVVGNKATVILSGECDGATGYDYVISKDRDCITNKDYDKVNKNILATDTTFYYTQQGQYWAYCHAWKRVDGKKVFSDWSNAYPFSVSAITPDQPMVTKVTTKGSTVTVTYTKSANATGYDLVLGGAVKKVNGEMRPVSYGTLVKKVYNGNTVTATFKNVKKGTYYAGLHAYNRTSEDGKKVFSPWSNTKKVTVK